MCVLVLVVPEDTDLRKMVEYIQWSTTAIALMRTGLKHPFWVDSWPLPLESLDRLDRSPLGFGGLESLLTDFLLQCGNLALARRCCKNTLSSFESLELFSDDSVE